MPFNAISNIRLPRYKVNSSSSFLTLEEVEKGKFTTIEKLIHLCNLEKDIIKKIDKIDRGELKDGEELWFNKPITINLIK